MALAVPSDYEQIPRFMPDVRTSTVLERSPGRLVVEQEAVFQFLMFSRTVHLILEITETGDTIRFADQSGRSFHHYQGSWQATEVGGGTLITYELVARPAFEVPKFILKRLLEREASRRINRLRIEIASCGAR